jgi:hypothetical protein
MSSCQPVPQAQYARTGSFMWAIDWKEADAEKLPL